MTVLLFGGAIAAVTVIIGIVVLRRPPSAADASGETETGDGAAGSDPDARG